MENHFHSVFLRKTLLGSKESLKSVAKLISKPWIFDLAYQILFLVKPEFYIEMFHAS